MESFIEVGCFLLLLLLMLGLLLLLQAWALFNCAFMTFEISVSKAFKGSSLQRRCEDGYACLSRACWWWQLLLPMAAPLFCGDDGECDGDLMIALANSLGKWLVLLAIVLNIYLLILSNLAILYGFQGRYMLSFAFVGSSYILQL
ncbi:hypothetical protein GUITHDRAFT_145437 [Guillardia theta CCMP2712]|uniref:Uncharacterized protein n=1 Tax=Guillardia theta (strain CCMP2712) TaxID=905079 RepID=L1IL17_GUITC|nr:hypothetical protein GUITHDRAFT_145437 [Guillardia theta CCMP2712]EKX36802.1 hypothetical protein GUITHDRAFT_145437 [Guillardia theta CCMP2712]|eukprot:XP_005823782.1 hypothetical protein GUITHDRAFT_145437 [Guillardia theta CCMP2712]